MFWLLFVQIKLLFFIIIVIIVVQKQKNYRDIKQFLFEESLEILYKKIILLVRNDFSLNQFKL